VRGEDDIALFQRILPWDHAAGALFVTEAGGMVTHWDGSPWRVGGSGLGVLAAATPRLWERAADVLLSPAAGLVERDRIAA
jgi:fructose-1,6-bisphosphatase/inositol monophosphatase family enzyme